jgi:hypothetical protein
LQLGSIEIKPYPVFYIIVGKRSFQSQVLNFKKIFSREGQKFLAQSASPTPFWTGSPTGVTYWRPMAKATGYARPKNDPYADRHPFQFSSALSR